MRLKSSFLAALKRKHEFEKITFIAAVKRREEKRREEKRREGKRR
jgi:hypothetical protein